MNNNYDKSTYIGYLHIQNGGIKIIHGKEDRKIIKTRNFILKELIGGLREKELPINRLPEYFSALEGKYVRNKMCGSGNSECLEAKRRVKKVTEKTIKGGMKLYGDKVKNILEINAPLLYKKFEKRFKVKGGFQTIECRTKLLHLLVPGSPGRQSDIEKLITTIKKYVQRCTDGEDDCNAFEDFEKFKLNKFEKDIFEGDDKKRKQEAIKQLLKNIATIISVYNGYISVRPELTPVEETEFKEVIKALVEKYRLLTGLSKDEIKQMINSASNDDFTIFLGGSINNYLANKFVEHRNLSY